MILVFTLYGVYNENKKNNKKYAEGSIHSKHYDLYIKEKVKNHYEIVTRTLIFFSILRCEEIKAPGVLKEFSKIRGNIH